jgi:hypothetical protein
LVYREAAPERVPSSLVMNRHMLANAYRYTLNLTSPTVVRALPALVRWQGETAGMFGALLAVPGALATVGATMLLFTEPSPEHAIVAVVGWIVTALGVWIGRPRRFYIDAGGVVALSKYGVKIRWSEPRSEYLGVCVKLTRLPRHLWRSHDFQVWLIHAHDRMRDVQLSSTATRFAFDETVSREANDAARALAKMLDLSYLGERS